MTVIAWKLHRCAFEENCDNRNIERSCEIYKMMLFWILELEAIIQNTIPRYNF